MFFLFSKLFDQSHKIANRHDIVGKFGLSTCNSFARQISYNLTEAKIKNYIIEFSWTSPLQAGNHAFVVYLDKSDATWGIDNLMSKSKRISGKTPLELAQNCYVGYKIGKIISVKPEFSF
jgi:hypothetical protein